MFKPKGKKWKEHVLLTCHTGVKYSVFLLVGRTAESHGEGCGDRMGRVIEAPNYFMSLDQLFGKNIL